MKTPSFEKGELVNIKSDNGGYVTAQVRRIEGINDELYSVVFEDMQTGDKFQRTYRYE